MGGGWLLTAAHSSDMLLMLFNSTAERGACDLTAC